MADASSLDRGAFVRITLAGSKDAVEGTVYVHDVSSNAVVLGTRLRVASSLCWSLHHASCHHPQSCVLLAAMVIRRFSFALLFAPTFDAGLAFLCLCVLSNPKFHPGSLARCALARVTEMIDSAASPSALTNRKLPYNIIALDMIEYVSICLSVCTMVPT